MKSIASMLFVLTAALLVSSPAQAGYADGMNQYAAYHVMRGGLDPMGTDSITVYNDVNPDGNELQGGVNLGPTHTWTISTPPVDVCEDDETLLVEYVFEWNARNKAVENSGVSGGYHATVKMDSAKDSWRINLGRGTGHFQSAGELAAAHFAENREQYADVNTKDKYEEWLEQNTPNFQGESDRRASARQLGNSTGRAWYRVTSWCICTDKLDTANLRDPGGLSRANTETATATTIPARFLTEGDSDPRQRNPFRMGEPVGDDLRSVNSTSGAVVWDFGDPPLKGQVRVE